MAAKTEDLKCDGDLDFEFNVSDKVRKYEEFINDCLKADLRKVHELRDKLYSNIADYLQLKTTIEKIKFFDGGKMKTQVDLGCNFYCQAEVKDTKLILVAVGYGFYVEFTLNEAENFIDQKVEYLTKQAEMLSKDSSKIKAHIKVALQGLSELQMLNFAGREGRST
ncbi:protein UXT homolog [Xenia sp. Carnegie-2017]|uniref:protein UXT homolog n=1 Tax=Xenia sp. Carnegie-2017 TaxID=2897299 RepID=UPI001F04B6A6|nr:protein UXT homolog [Xenia sp. Carnegie-2017]